KVAGAYGRTPNNRSPIKRVVPNAIAAPATTPAAVTRMPRAITSRSTPAGPAPSAMRSPSSRVLCETTYAMTPYNPIDASSSANVPQMASSVTAMRCDDVDRSITSRNGRTSYVATPGSSAWTVRLTPGPTAANGRDDRTNMLNALRGDCRIGT